jgi:hypothetical protein
MKEQDLPIKVMSFRVNPAVVNVHNFIGDLSWDLRIGEAVVAKIIYPEGHSHRFYVWRSDKGLTWTMEIS